MMDSPNLYLYILFFSVILPFLWSFESKMVAYSKSFAPLLVSTLIVGSFFIIWDIIFTHKGIWGFNPRYLSGIYFFNLPLGEWLFFLIIPFCSIFIYRVFNYFRKSPVLENSHHYISYFLIGFSIVLALIYYDRSYTFITFVLLASLIYLHVKVLKTKWMGRFYVSYLFVLIPFSIVNGILTGSFIEDQVVWYNNFENMGIRIGTIPFEDAFYGMILILGITSLYEYFGTRWNMEYAQESRTE